MTPPGQRGKFEALPNCLAYPLVPYSPAPPPGSLAWDARQLQSTSCGPYEQGNKLAAPPNSSPSRPGNLDRELR